MSGYTFLAHYRGNYYLSQYQAEDLMSALRLWGEGLDKKIFTLSKRRRILNDILNPDHFPVPVKGVKNVWCACYLSDKSFLILDIIETVCLNER